MTATQPPPGAIQAKAKPERLWRGGLLFILLVGLSLRVLGLAWGQAYCYFAQGDGLEAYSVAVDYGKGEPKALYLGQPNYNERAKLPGPFWTVFCFTSLRSWGSIEGVVISTLLLNAATIYLTYGLAKRTLGPAAAFWSALLTATAPSAVYYSVGVYNPDVMAFLGALLFLALWQTVTEDRSRHIAWVGFLFLMMPQFHMSGLALLPAVVLLLALSSARLNLAWLLGGLFAGAALYIPYLRGDAAHGWQNTVGMLSGKGGYSVEGLKAISIPLNFLISWAPQWTRSGGEFRALGAACFGWYGLFLLFNALAVCVAAFLIVGMFQDVRAAFQGLWRSPRRAFESSRGVLFLAVLLLVPLAIAVVSGRPFHTRYCLVLVPALLSLAGGAAAKWLSSPRVGSMFLTALIVVSCGNVWFMAAMYHYQGKQIENGPVFIPSFRKLEAVYQQLKAHAGADHPIQVDDAAYLAGLAKGDKAREDVSLVRRYVAIREKEAALLSTRAGEAVIYKLCRADQVEPHAAEAAYRAYGIALIAQGPAR